MGESLGLYQCWNCLINVHNQYYRVRELKEQYTAWLRTHRRPKTRRRRTEQISHIGESAIERYPRNREPHSEKKYDPDFVVEDDSTVDDGSFSDGEGGSGSEEDSDKDPEGLDGNSCDDAESQYDELPTEDGYALDDFVVPDEAPIEYESDDLEDETFSDDDLDEVQVSQVDSMADHQFEHNPFQDDATAPLTTPRKSPKSRKRKSESDSDTASSSEESELVRTPSVSSRRSPRLQKKGQLRREHSSELDDPKVLVCSDTKDINTSNDEVVTENIVTPPRRSKRKSTRMPTAARCLAVRDKSLPAASDSGGDEIIDQSVPQTGPRMSPRLSSGHRRAHDEALLSPSSVGSFNDGGEDEGGTRRPLKRLRRGRDITPGQTDHAGAELDAQLPTPHALQRTVSTSYPADECLLI